MTDHIFDNSFDNLLPDSANPEDAILVTAFECDGGEECRHCQPKPCSCTCRPCPPRPCPCPPPLIDNPYAQYFVFGNPPSLGYLSFGLQFQSGNLTSSNDTTIFLSAGYVYLVNYVTLATPEANQYYQLVPYINGQPRLNYSSIGNASANSRNASATGSFIVNESADNAATLQIRITYPEATNNIDVTGVLSIIPISATGPIV